MADPFFCFYSWQCRYALVRIHSTILDKDHLLCKLHNYRHRASLAYAPHPLASHASTQLSLVEKS
jgi:hypothetical protein